MQLPDVHAFLSASGSSRWIHCPPSAAFEKKFPAETSPFAEEGTLAHAWGEYFLKKKFHPGTEVRPEKEMDGEMEEAVRYYVDSVMSYFNVLDTADMHPVIYIEQRLDFSRWVPGGFGTGDAVIVSDEGVDIYDLKFGKGVKVPAKDNSQLRLYALGAYDMWSMVYDISKVTMTIIQPRLDHIDREELDTQALLDWGDKVRIRAELAMQGKGEAKAGEHCRWCRARHVCKVRHDYMLQLLPDKPVGELTPDEVAAIVLKSTDLKRYIEEVTEYAMGKALQGEKWPGVKLVAGRSVRKIADPTVAAGTLLKDGYTNDQIYKPLQLKTITELEKVCGKKHFAELLSDCIVKPEGKPTLVAESDKRPAINPSASDFDDSLL